MNATCNNNMDNFDTLVGLGFLAVLCLLIFYTGECVGARRQKAEFQKNAIENGVGRYNPTNAVFEWIKQ